jgi:hypothetical protein
MLRGDSATIGGRERPRVTLPTAVVQRFQTTLAWASVRECHPNTGKHGAALVVMWAGDLPNDA